jgi:hypothetical protein
MACSLAYITGPTGTIAFFDTKSWHHFESPLYYSVYFKVLKFLLEIYCKNCASCEATEEKAIVGIVWFGLGLVPQPCNPTPIDFTLGFCRGVIFFAPLTTSCAVSRFESEI